jgi:hypothetical protein
MFYEDVFRELNKKRVDYVVAGGVALVLHGVVRLTADLDLIVNLEEKNFLRFIKTIEALGYKPKIPVKTSEILDPSIRQKWIKEKNMKVLSFYNPALPIGLIDVLIHQPIRYKEIKRHSVKIKSGALGIPVVSIEDLIRLKRISGRPQDITDIAMLKEIKKRGKG